MTDPIDPIDPIDPSYDPSYDPRRDALIYRLWRADDRLDLDGSLRAERYRINHETDQERAARLEEFAGQDNPHLLGDVPSTPPRRLAAAAVMPVAAAMQVPVRPQWGRRILAPQQPSQPSSLRVFLDNYEQQQQQLAQQQLAQQQLAQQQQQLAQQQQQQQEDPIEASPPPIWRTRIQRLQGENPEDPIDDSGGGKRKSKKSRKIKSKSNKKKSRRSRSRSRFKKTKSAKK